jgi:hypothetical protein
VGERMAYAMDRFYNRMRHPAAYRVRLEDAVAAPLDALRRHKYGLLVTFRRNGEPVPSPVWMAVDSGGRAYVQTGAKSGKVKRLRNNPIALISASTARGRPTSPVILGRARILPADEIAHAETTLSAAFGLGRKLYMRVFPMGPDVVAYIEIRPGETS